MTQPPRSVVKRGRLLLDSRVVIGQLSRNSLFLQAFHEGRDRCRIFGKSRLISSPYVLSMMCKTLESNKSHGGLYLIRGPIELSAAWRYTTRRTGVYQEEPEPLSPPRHGAYH